MPSECKMLPFDKKNLETVPYSNDDDKIHSGGNGNGGSTMNERITKIENNIISLDKRLTKVEVKLDIIESDVREIKSEVHNLRWWILGSMAAIIAIIVAFGHYQTSWFLHSIDKSEAANRALLNEIDKRHTMQIENLKVK